MKTKNVSLYKKRQDASICCLPEMYFNSKDTDGLIVKVEEIYMMVTLVKKGSLSGDIYIRQDLKQRILPARKKELSQ